MLRVASLALAIAVIGCVDVPEEEGEQTHAIGGGCQDDFCPTNSSVIDTFPFHELNTGGLPNDQGFVLKYLRKNNIKYAVRVINGRIQGQNSIWGTLSGNALVNSQLWITRAGQEYVVAINAVVSVPMWAKLPAPAITPNIEAYKMDWTNVINGYPGREYHNVCEAAMLPRESPDLLGAPNYVTFVYEGERIDSKSKQIYAYDRTWFNVGCAGHILAKLYQMGHTGAAAVNGYTTTLDERQTMISSIGATYCGDGYSFTVPGISLTWFDSNKWMEYPGAPGGVTQEARWKGYGPTCLDDPRVLVHPTADSLAVFPDIETAIASRCARPAYCVDQDPWNLDGYHVATAHPVP